MTSSGLNPTELFDDVEDDVPCSMASNQIGKCDDVMQQSYESGAHIVSHSKSEHCADLNVGTKLEEISLHTTPSYSLISVHNDIKNNRGIKKGVSSYYCV